jgi:hypothetical protein
MSSQASDEIDDPSLTCCRVLTIWFLELTSTFTGLVRLARCSFCTLEVMVAEKR